MTTEHQDGPVIKSGYAWSMVVNYTRDPVAFPANATFVAHVRRKRSDANPVATLNTANGGIVRQSDSSIMLVIAGSVSAGWEPGVVHLDVVRDDVDPDEHFGFELTVPVEQPITRGLP